MSTAILSALRHQTQLHGNTFLLAIEIAHRLNAQGYGRVSYQMMAWKAHCSRRTAIRRMHDLEGTIFQVTRYRTREGNTINLYKCLIPWKAFYHDASATARGDTLSSTLPPPKAAEEKSRSLAEDLRRQQWAVHNLPMTEDARARCLEEIGRLETLGARR